MTQIVLSPDRYFSPDPSQRQAAAQLFAQVEHLPLVCPHGHVDPRMFADPDYTFGSPTELLIIPDHYIFRMLYSQGIPLEDLGIPRKDGGASESDQRKIWQIFAENLHLFHGTPTGSWFKEEMVLIFDLPEKLTAHNARQTPPGMGWLPIRRFAPASGRGAFCRPSVRTRWSIWTAPVGAITCTAWNRLPG